MVPSFGDIYDDLDVAVPVLNLDHYVEDLTNTMAAASDSPGHSRSLLHPHTIQYHATSPSSLQGLGEPLHRLLQVSHPIHVLFDAIRVPQKRIKRRYVVVEHTHTLPETVNAVNTKTGALVPYGEELRIDP